MRLWHLIFLVAVSSLVMALARDPMTRVLLIVFVTGLGEIALGVFALVALFQTLGAFGQATTVGERAEAIAATGIVLTIATLAMDFCLLVGVWLVVTLV